MSTTDRPSTPPLPPHIEQMRAHLMDTLTDLRNREAPMDVDRARAVADVARVLVDSAKVEVDYIKVTGAPKSAFIEPAVPALPGEGGIPTPHNPFPRVTRHTLGD